jgi:hypothetical protein
LFRPSTDSHDIGDNTQKSMKWSEQDRWNALIKDSPELMHLLKEFEDKLKEIQQVIKPWLER